jgi:hypothetical protein
MNSNNQTVIPEMAITEFFIYLLTQQPLANCKASTSTEETTTNIYKQTRDKKGNVHTI